MTILLQFASLYDGQEDLYVAYGGQTGLVACLEIYNERIWYSCHWESEWKWVVHVVMFLCQNLNEEQLKPSPQPRTGCVYNKDDYLVFQARGFNQRHLVSQFNHFPLFVSLTTTTKLMLMHEINELDPVANSLPQLLKGWNIWKVHNSDKWTIETFCNQGLLSAVFASRQSSRHSINFNVATFFNAGKVINVKICVIGVLFKLYLFIPFFFYLHEKCKTV